MVAGVAPYRWAMAARRLPGAHAVHAPGVAVLGRHQLQSRHELVAAALGHLQRVIRRGDALEHGRVQRGQLGQRGIGDIRNQRQAGGRGGLDGVVLQRRIERTSSRPYSAAFFSMMVMARMMGT